MSAITDERDRLLAGRKHRVEIAGGIAARSAGAFGTGRRRQSLHRFGRVRRMARPAGRTNVRPTLRKAALSAVETSTIGAR